MTNHVNINGSWKTVSGISAKIDGAWKTVDQGYTKVDGVWKKSYDSLPTLTGTTATATADSSYYYITYTNSTSTEGQTTGTLVVKDQPITLDYVLVAGGGGTSGARYIASSVQRWNYRYHYSDTCQDYYGYDCCCGCGDIYCYNYRWTLYCDEWDCYYIWPRLIDRSWGYYNDDAQTVDIYRGPEGGGGAGGVITGSITLNPGTYNISIGNAGLSRQASSPYSTRGTASSAFGKKAWGGGAATWESFYGAWGGDYNWLENQAAGGSGAAGGEGVAITSTTKYLDNNNTVQTVQNYSNGASQTVTNAQGSAGAPTGGENNGLTYPYLSSNPVKFSCTAMATNNWLQSYSIKRCYESFGTGGSVLEAGWGYSRNYASNPYSDISNGPVGGVLVNVDNSNVINSFTYTDNTGMKNHAGLSVLGITVGFAGDSIESRRTGSQVISNPANTGAGAGFTHSAGSGVLRIRVSKTSVRNVTTA